MKKARIDNEIYEVVSQSEYMNNSNLYVPTRTAILNDKVVLPIRGKNDDRPGIYPDGDAISFVKSPQEDTQYYSNNIIDFDNIGSIREVIGKQKQVRDLERDILTTPGDIFSPKVLEADSPEMVALKTAVVAKHIDLDKYASRFGETYNNDKRLFKKHTISLTKLRDMLNNLDMKGTLIIEDKSDNVPNPIGKKIVADLTGGGYTDGENDSI